MRVSEIPAMLVRMLKSAKASQLFSWLVVLAPWVPILGLSFIVYRDIWIEPDTAIITGPNTMCVTMTSGVVACKCTNILDFRGPF